MSLKDTFGKNLKYYRYKAGLSQEKLAEIVGVSTSVIGGLESSKVNQGVSVPTLYRISVALEVPIDKLITKRK